MAVRFRHALQILAACLFTLGMAPAAAHAQNATIRGRVVDATGGPIANATIRARQAGREVAQATSAADGAYSLSVPAGGYDIEARRIGYARQVIAGVLLASGAMREQNITLTASATVLEQVVVTGTPLAGGGEKVLEAPAHIGIVQQGQIRITPSLTMADHLKAQPGVDVSSGGLVQSNIVSRGFNNAFSGSMLVLQDNRFTSVPSLRVNVPFMSTATNEDIERIEVLLGPAAALYGPNSANGVLHVITRSPFTSQGGTITLDAGERGVLRGSGRYAGLIGEKVGYKFSGEYMQGDDWRYRDPAEPDSVLRPTGAIVGGVGTRVRQLNARDFAIERMAGEARVDVRLNKDLEWINTVGRSRAGNYIEITGANGAAQARNWEYTSMQSRMRWKRTFAQVFYNMSNSGSADSLDASGTYLLRTGNPIVDNSNVLTAQLQQALDVGTKQSFVVGGDYIATNPQTGGTINGRNEDIDDVTEMGAYLHSTTRLTPQWDFVGALRLDNHSEQDDNFFSPRAAVVFKPTENHNFRLTYNRAFSTPANFSFFLDLPQGRIPLTPTVGYGIRALGVPETGFYYPTGSSTGAGGLYMRSPFPVLGANPAGAPAFLPESRIDAQAGLMYRTLVAANQATFINALIAAGVTPGNAPTVFGALVGTTAPTPAQVATVMRLFNPSGVGTPAGPFATVMTPDQLLPVDRLKSTLSSVWEVGYKGILAERWRFAVNAWAEQKENFTTPAVSVTPNAFMDPATLGAYIGGILAQQAAAGRVPAAAVPALATAFTTSLAQVPVGTVMLEQPGVAPDAGLTNRSDLVFTYRNVDKVISFYGVDLAADFLVNDRVTLLGTFGRVVNVVFPEIPSGVGPLRLNAPQNKATLAAQYGSELTKWGGEIRGRYIERFAVNSGVYVGGVPTNMLLDVSGSYRLPVQFGKGARVSLSATNLLDERVPTFIGVPAVGRLVMTRLQYEF